MSLQQEYADLASQKTKRHILELGPGQKPAYSDSIKIDRVALPNIDIVADFSAGLPFIPDNSVDVIHSSHVLEHLADTEVIMREIYRVLKPGGEVHIIVPHHSNPLYYNDYTHKSPWGIYTVAYFSNKAYFKRPMPTFYNDVDFTIQSVFIGFYSCFKIRNAIFKVFQAIFNINTFTQELYEGAFSKVIPAYEVRLLLSK